MKLPLQLGIKSKEGQEKRLREFSRPPAVSQPCSCCAPRPSWLPPSRFRRAVLCTAVASVSHVLCTAAIPTKSLEPGESMDAATALSKREDLLRDGFCVIENVLPPHFVAELQRETDRLNDGMPHAPDTKYQGTHLGIRFDDHPDLSADEDLSEEGPHGFSVSHRHPSASGALTG